MVSEPSSAEMVTTAAKSLVKCLTPAPSKLVFLVFLGVTEGVAVGVVLLEARDTLLISSVLPFPEILKSISKNLSTRTHCSKSSFFVQKFNFDFPRKLSTFWGEKLVKMFWFWTF